MMVSDTGKNLLALWLVKGLGPKRIRVLLEHFETPAAIREASVEELIRVEGISAKTAALIVTARNSALVTAELERLKKYDLVLMDMMQEQYSTLLQEIYTPPPILYVKGKIDFNAGIPIAIVGARKASFSGKSFCQKLVKELAAYSKEIVIVSGLALGIDTVAHQAALDNGLKTIAVLAGGLSDIYPASNRKLSQRISENGALVTEFPIETKPAAQNFPLRNRIISGLSRGTVVVEAGERSGALITARDALEQNRELFAVPGLVDSQFYVGTNKLIQRGQAKLIMNAADVLEEIDPELLTIKRPASHSPQQTLDIELSDTERAILEKLDGQAMHQDVLAATLKIPVPRLLAALTMLEMKGFISSKAGSLYTRA